MECILAPEYAEGALEILKQKQNVRLMELAKEDHNETSDFKKVSGGLLVQDKDNSFVVEKDLTFATKRKPTKEELNSLLFTSFATVLSSVRLMSFSPVVFSTKRLLTTSSKTTVWKEPIRQ